METIILVLIVPFLIFQLHILYCLKNKNTLSIKANLYPFLFSALVTSLIVGASYFSEVVDSEVRNGEVIDKYREVTSCTHTYQCNCTKNGCSTCFLHSHDYNWVVDTNIPYKFNIDRVDAQGVKEPTRWSTVKKGDPVSDSFTYINYIKGAHHSLINKQTGDYTEQLKKVPDYPKTTYDYYHVNRVIGVGIPVKQEWNEKLQSLLSKLGPQYQVNVVYVLTNESESFNDLIEYAWNGGKKNDVVVVIHMDTNNTINSVYIMSWTTNQLFKVELRDTIMAMKEFDFDSVIKITESQIKKNWQRMHMKDFSYLSADIDISWVMIATSIVIGIIAYFGMLYYVNVHTSKNFIRRRRFF